MGKKMKNAPVYFTVAQVRFNPVLNMEGYLSTIQERMRKTLFPDFRRENIQQLILPFAPPADGSQPPSPSFVPKARCIFGSIDRSTEFVLENSSLGLQTTAYETSDIFFKTMLDGLKIIHEAVQLDFTERIGLRYCDAVLPTPQQSLSDYLTPEVLGLCNKLEGKLIHSYSETVVMNKSGQLVSRVIIQDGHVGLPIDLAELAPRIKPKFSEPEGRHAIIDTDASCEQREVFNLERLNSKLEEFHTEIWKSFRSIVTPFALKSWA